MTRLTLESAAITQLRLLSGPVEVCDESGRTVGYFYPASEKQGVGGVQSPFSRAELEQRRQQRTGRPLSEILKDLERS